MDVPPLSYFQVSDKRFTFNHFLQETSISNVLDDFYEDKQDEGFHRMRSLIEHRALTVHNDVTRHWSGLNGAPFPDHFLERVKGSLAEYDAGMTKKKYIDVHNYHFTPQSLAFIVDAVYNLGLANLRVHRLYETLEGRFEFGIVLKKCTPEPDSQSEIETEPLFPSAEAL